MFFFLAILAFVCFSVCFIAYCVKGVGYKGSAYQLNTHKPFSKVLFDKGNYGEYLVYNYLKGISPPRYFLFNVYLPKDNGKTTEIDVLLIHQSGIYVFESKNYSGWIFGTESQRQWTQTLPSGNKSKKNHFFNPIMQNELHIKWLKNVLSNYQDLVYHSYVLFSDRCTLKNITLTSGKAQVMNRYRIFSSVSAQANQFGAIISQPEMETIYNTLCPYSQTTDEQKQKHISDINAHHPGAAEIENSVHTNKSENAVPLNSDQSPQSQQQSPAQLKVCPRCGKPIILRTAQKGANAGQQFWGCSAFPHCRYIEKIDESSNNQER
jgi:hypothetical protein